MLNKLSYLLTDSLCLRCLSIDDFGDEGLIGQQVPIIPNENITADFMQYTELKKSLWKGSITKEEMRKLSKLTEKIEKKTLLSGEIDLPTDYILDILTSAKECGLFRAEMFWLAHNMRVWEVNELPTVDEYSPEWFGMYSSDSDSNYFPVIKLNKERTEQGAEILRQWSKVNLSRNMLYAVVMIYGMANSIMDPANKLKDNNGELLPRKERDEQQVSEADVFNNKVLATIITLLYFDSFDQNHYQQVREYFSLLSLAYQVGVAEYEKLRDTKYRWREIAGRLCG